MEPTEGLGLFVRPKFLIGITGFAGAGKDSVRSILEADHGFEGKAFADAVRKFAEESNMLLYDPAFVSQSDLNFQEGKARYKDIVSEYGYETAKRQFPCVRAHLVSIGHGARESISPTVWVDKILPLIPVSMRDIPCYKNLEIPRESLCISDTRYHEGEEERIRLMGGIIFLVTRPEVVAANETEGKSIPLIEPDFILRNDGTLEELRATVRRALELHQMSHDGHWHPPRGIVV